MVTHSYTKAKERQLRLRLKKRDITAKERRNIRNRIATAALRREVKLAKKPVRQAKRLKTRYAKSKYKPSVREKIHLHYYINVFKKPKPKPKAVPITERRTGPAKKTPVTKRVQPPRKAKK